MSTNSHGMKPCPLRFAWNISEVASIAAESIEHDVADVLAGARLTPQYMAAQWNKRKRERSENLALARKMLMLHGNSK